MLQVNEIEHIYFRKSRGGTNSLWNSNTAKYVHQGLHLVILFKKAVFSDECLTPLNFRRDQRNDVRIAF